MRRFLLGLVIGFGLGWVLSQRASRVEERVDLREHPMGVLGAMARHPSARRLGRVVDLTSERGLRAIRRARAGIQRRLVADADDVSMN